MNNQTISLGRILGISIRLDYSWFLIFALLTWSLAVSYFPAELNGLPSAAYWVMGAATAMMLFVSVLLHELGHSVVAMRYKIPVRKITLFIFGGVAEIGTEPPTPVAEFLIAIAGPIVSFTLAALFATLELGAGALAPIFVLAKYLAFINGTLALFNLIPGFPLDGGRVFRAVLWGITGSLSRATEIAANLGRVIAFLFVAFGLWQTFTGDLSGLWIVFIGWFLLDAASGQLEQQKLHDLLARHPVSEAMNRNYAVVPAEMSLQELVDRYVVGNGQRSFVVQRGGAVVGFVTVRQIRRIPRAQWTTTAVAQAMIPSAQVTALRPDTELWSVVEQMGREGSTPMPVISDGYTWGILSGEDVSIFVRRLKELNAA
jgi:Zn-dependent protease/CBS domain-containing protein